MADPTDLMAYDEIARILGAKLQESFGQPVVIDNRPGAGGAVGAAAGTRYPAENMKRVYL